MTVKERPISVLHVVSSLKLGGAERFTLDLAQLQRKNNFDPRILSLGGEDEFLVSVAKEKLIPLSISGPNQSRMSRYRSIFQLLKTTDVVHFHNSYGLRFFLPLMFLYPKKKYIYTRHGIHSFSSRKWKLLHKTAHRFINYTTFVTASGLDVFKRDHNWNASRLKVVENGVLIPDKSKGRVHNPISFGSVGRMVELKGQPFLLDSIKLVEETSEPTEDGPRISLHFFGTGPLEENLKQQSKTTSGYVQIEFHGVELDREKIYDTIDVLIVSSSSEGMSLVIMEAMARGIPVIATNVGGNNTLVADGKSGIIVSYGDALSLSNAIVKFINEPELIYKLGKAARQEISDNYSLQKTLDTYSDLYRN